MVIISHPDRCARAALVNILFCTSQRQSRQPYPYEVMLNGADGMDWETFCDCSIMYAVKSELLFVPRNPGLQGEIPLGFLCGKRPISRPWAGARGAPWLLRSRRDRMDRSFLTPRSLLGARQPALLPIRLDWCRNTADNLQNGPANGFLDISCHENGLFLN